MRHHGVVVMRVGVLVDLEVAAHLELLVRQERPARARRDLRVSGRGQASGAGFEIRVAHLWTLRDGVAIRGEGFGNRAEALKAAGIAEQP